MDVSYSTVILGVIFVAVLLVFFFQGLGGEGFRCDLSDGKHCPGYCCSKLPNMYSSSPCNDPFSWGQFYTTGPNPKLVNPVKMVEW